MGDQHKSCPFCGSGNVVATGYYREEGLWWVIECQDCHAYGHHAATYDRAWEYWDSYVHKYQEVSGG